MDNKTPTRPGKGNKIKIYKYVNGALSKTYNSLVEAAEAEKCNRFSLRDRIEGKLGYRGVQSKDHVFFSYKSYEVFDMVPTSQLSNIEKLNTQLLLEIETLKSQLLTKKQSFWKKLWNL